MNECSLGEHDIEFVGDSLEDGGEGGGVGDHSDCSGYGGDVASRDGGGGLGVDASLESSRAPVDETDRVFAAHVGDSLGHVLGRDVTSVHETASHVLAASRIAFGHGRCGLKGGHCDVVHGHSFVRSLVGGDDGSIGRKHEVNSGVGHQIGLELVDIHIESSRETQGGCQTTNCLAHQAVEVGIPRPLNV